MPTDPVTVVTPVDLVLAGIVASALVTVATMLYRQLIERAKRAEERNDRLDSLVTRMADGVETLLKLALRERE